MAVQIIYFVHGTTTDNEKNISSGWTDAKLSELGIKQAKELRKQINGKKFEAVFSSDLKRAVDSANLAFKNSAPIFTDNRLRECNYGNYNGKPSQVVEPLQEENIKNCFPGGESYLDVKRRIEDFLGFLKKEYNGKTVAIVAHKAPQIALEVIIKNQTWKQAFANDWRRKKAWQPGWEYTLV